MVAFPKLKVLNSFTNEKVGQVLLLAKFRTNLFPQTLTKSLGTHVVQLFMTSRIWDTPALMSALISLNA